MPSRVRRRALSADAIVDRAIRTARAEGLAAVSMRRLAEDFEATPMALYRHVADREDLLVRMLGVVADGIAPPDPDQPPRDRLRAAMTQMHDAFRRDPWVVRALATEGLASPRILPVVDAIFAALAEAGLSPAHAREAFGLLFQYTYGEVLVSHHDRADSVGRQIIRDADDSRFPHLAAVISGTEPPVDRFEANLERVLDGILGPR
jgi:AcrR family transcriptional regulator